MNLAPASLILFATLLLAGCGSQRSQEGPQLTPAEVRAQVARLIPSNVVDRQGWATDIQVAFTAQELATVKGNFCAVLAVTEQESTYQADPAVPGLAKIARQEIDRRAARLHLPGFLVDSALDIRSPTGKTYAQRLAAVRTERQLSVIFDDFIGMVPLGRQLFGTFNPVHTGGPMQVSIAFAQQHAENYPYTTTGSVRDEVFTRRGGLYFGIAHLLGYEADYPEPLYRFADFNAGWYASRNAAFQAAVARASGIKLALDGDLIRYGSEQASATELAVHTLAKQLDMSTREIRRDLEKGDSESFSDSTLWKQTFILADKMAGKRLPREVLPGIKLESPKITRNLTTAWFAQRVDGRYQQCMTRR